MGEVRRILRRLATEGFGEILQDEVRMTYPAFEDEVTQYLLRSMDRRLLPYIESVQRLMHAVDLTDSGSCHQIEFGMLEHQVHAATDEARLGH